MSRGNFYTIIILILITFFVSQIIYSQDDKTVTLVVSGEGKTKDDSKQSALRNAIEQAFGTFISSKSDILNDELIKDEIVSVSNGNIQKFEVLSEGQLPDGNYYNTLKATVSVSKLTSFCESKGISVEFKGALFSFNIKQQLLNETNEVKAIENMCQVLKQFSDHSFNYSLSVGDPSQDGDKWSIPLVINISINNNFFNIPKIIYKTLKELSLTKDEALNYIKLNKPVIPISFAASENEFGYFLLRNSNSVMMLIEQMYYFNHSIINFNVENGLAEINLERLSKIWIIDKDFRPLIRLYSDGSDPDAYAKASVFYNANCPGWDAPPANYFTSQANCLNPILQYEKIYSSGGEWDGKRYKPKGLVSFWTTIYIHKSNVGSWNPLDKYFIDQFSFVNKLLDQLIDGVTPGVVISFDGIDINNKNLIIISALDYRTLDEINKIKEYKIIPGSD